MAPFLTYVAAFHLVWIAWPWFLYPKMTAALGEETAAYALVQLSIRVIVWVVPVWLYLRYVDRVEPIAYLKLKRHAGFVLRKFTERFNFWFANLVTSILFVAVHLPGWIALHALKVETAATIFVFGFVMGAAVRWSDSLWAPIAAHSANDFLSYVIFRLS